MKTAAFDYHLPPELIAQQPAARREASRLLVVDRTTRSIEHRTFAELPSYLRGGDLLMRNTARVLPARLFGERAGGGAVECLLLRPAAASCPVAGVVDPGPASTRPTTADAAAGGPGSSAFAEASAESTTPATNHAPSVNAELWWCLLRPGRRLPPGATFGRSGEFTAEVREKSTGGEYLVSLKSARSGESVPALAERLGVMPLPPYIKRARDEAAVVTTADRERYQTVFADPQHTVAVAAPTAGLHFTDALLEDIQGRGVTFADVILHVGLGTFRPIETDEVADHQIHRERIEIPAATREKLDRPVAGRRVAVGTTAVRTVEHYARSPRRGANPGQAFTDEADLFLHPPGDFRLVEALITNFHLPRSTLLCLVAAFLTPGSTDGVNWLQDIYAAAIAERYRFLSYGDAMLIL